VPIDTSTKKYQYFSAVRNFVVPSVLNNMPLIVSSMKSTKATALTKAT
jgi:hypothetical protein